MQQTAFLAFFGHMIGVQTGRVAWSALTETEWARLSELAGTIDRVTSRRNVLVQAIASCAAYIALSLAVTVLLVLASVLAPDFMRTPATGQTSYWPLALMWVSFLAIVIGSMLFTLRMSVAYAPSESMRVNLVPQAADAELAAKIRRGATLLVLKRGIVVGLCGLGAGVLLLQMMEFVLG